MRFLVDGMLGGLARWLRILGHAVQYNPEQADNTLLSLAEKEEMILLTSDEELFRRAKARNVDSLLIRGRNESERLAEVARALRLPLRIDMTMTKCPACGRDLRAASGKEEVSGRVPMRSLELYDDFWVCSSKTCGKVYWMGSHWRQIHNTLERAKNLSGGIDVQNSECNGRNAIERRGNPPS